MVRNFGELLRETRLAVNLSQEALAEAAKISTAAIGSYEQGVRLAPRRETVKLLADALTLSGKARTEFESAARRKPAPRASSATAVASSGNLQTEATSFVGRDNEANEIVELLYRNRVVTITGPGGIGKTRIARRVASRLGPSRSEGSWFIDFSSIQDPLLVENRIASVVNLPFAPSDNAGGALASGLKGRDILLILDNCEHLLEAIGATPATIASHCPSVFILATSRERLRISSETVYRLSPLPTSLDDPPNAAEALKFSSIQLFVERCERADPRFTLTDVRVPAVAEICRRLDGIPLALELAAAQLPALGLNDLRSEVASHLEALAGGPRDLPARQQTLRATLDWSFSLLAEEEALLLERLSIFRGGFTLAAAKAVCSDGRLKASEIARLLTSLVEKSLVVTVVRDDDVRYSLLEVTGAYAFARMETSSETSRIVRRHAEWCAAFADAAERTMLEVSRESWNKQVYPEFGNIYQALEWAMAASGDMVIAGRIVGGLRAFWTGRARTEELLRLTDLVFERIDLDADAAVVAGLYLARSTCGSDPLHSLTKATAIRERLGNQRGLINCYLGLATIHADRSEVLECERALERGLELARALGLARAFPLFLAVRADADIRAERFHQARATLEHACELMEAAGALDCAVVLTLAFVQSRLGDLRGAAERTETFASAAQAIGDAYSAIGASAMAASLWLQLEEVEHARELARTALIGARGVNRTLAAHSILIISIIAALKMRSSRAARMFGFAKTVLLDESHTGEKHCPICEQCRRASELLVEQLSEAELKQHLAQGALLTEELAAREALLK